MQEGPFTIVPGRGASLFVEAMNVTSDTMHRIALEILVWMTGMAFGRSCYPASIWEERLAYLRATFAMTTQPELRETLVAKGVCFPITALARGLIDDPAEEDSASVIVTALVNLLYETKTKLEMVNKHSVIPLMMRCMQSNSVRLIANATRGIFAISAVAEFKPVIVRHPDMVAGLLRLLWADNVAVRTNSAGALANIAIHPDGKEMIATTNGVLHWIIVAALAEAETPVVSHLCRCMFSVSVNAAYRQALSLNGVVRVIDRYINSADADVVTNVVGCLGNLCIGDNLAGWHAYAHRLIPVFKTCTHKALTRQLARFIGYFVEDAAILPALFDVFDTIVDRFASSTDLREMQDLAKTLFCLVKEDADRRKAMHTRGALLRCLNVYEQFATKGANFVYLARLCHVLSQDGEAIAWAASETNAYYAISVLSRMAAEPDDVVRHAALGCMANMAASAEFASTLKLHPALIGHCVSLLFADDSRPVRTEAARLVAGCTGRQIEVLADVAEFGGEMGERYRHARDAATIFDAVFQIEQAQPQAPCGAEDLGGGVKRIVVRGPQGDRFQATVFAPLIEARCPAFFANTLLFELEASEVAWSRLFVLVSVWYVNDTVKCEAAGLAEALSIDLGTDEIKQVQISGCDFSLVVSLPSDKATKLREMGACIEDDDVAVFPVHRHVLAARSGYFRAMFAHTWSPGDETVIDTPIDVVIVIISYMYFGVDALLRKLIAEDVDLLLQTCQEASKYQIWGLQRFCEAELVRHLATDVGEISQRIADIDAPLLKLFMVASFVADQLAFDMGILAKIYEQTGMWYDKEGHAPAVVKSLSGVI